jgi:hypothetical protein
LALTQTEQLVLIAVLLVLMAFVVFFELKVMRRKSKEVRAASQKKDEAFNAVLTTRTVLNVVRNRGGRVGEAPALLDRAKDSLNRGRYDACIDFCEKARSELTSSSPALVRPAAVPDAEAKDRLEAVAESIVSVRKMPVESDTYTGTKLDSPGEGNYLGAKFEISAAKADIGKAVSSGWDTAAADGFMVEAEAAFAAGKFDKALSMAVKARKALSASSEDEVISLRRPEEDRHVAEPEVYEVMDEAAEPAPERLCKDCGAVLEKDDVFCPICGARVPLQACLSCGAKPRPDDKFCRKCGFKIG